MKTESEGDSDTPLDPLPTDEVSFSKSSQVFHLHYKGTLPSGKTFDHSRKKGRTRPIKFKPHQLIKGWTEALLMMSEGDRWELFIPPELGYGIRGVKGTIPSNSALIFVIEVIKIEDAPIFFYTTKRGQTWDLIKPPLELVFETVVFDIPLPTDDYFGGYLDITVLHLICFMALYLCVQQYAIKLELRASKAKALQKREVLVAKTFHILVQTEEKCASIKERILAKQDTDGTPLTFPQAARKYSVCPHTQVNGGSLGFLAKGQTVFDEVMWNPGVGIIEGPFKTEDGWHLVLVSERGWRTETRTEKNKNM